MLDWLRDGALLPDNTPWMALTLGGSAFFALLELCLDIRQINQLRRDSLPRALHDYLRPETFRQMQAWNVQRMTFLRAESTLAWMLESVILYFHLLPYLWSLSLWLVEMFAPNVESRIPRGLVFIFVVSFFSSLIKMPGELYRYLRIDRTLISQQPAGSSAPSPSPSPSPSAPSPSSIPHSPSNAPPPDDRTLLTWFGDQLTMFLVRTLSPAQCARSARADIAGGGRADAGGVSVPSGGVARHALDSYLTPPLSIAMR